MARHRGNSNDHEPGGDPSWLGGKDRGPDPQSSNGWSSDFAPQRSQRPYSDFGDQPAPSADSPAQDADSMAPRFGESGGRSVSRQDSAQWTSDFSSSRRGGRAGGGRSSRSVKAQVTGLLGSVVGLIVFAVFAYRAGMDMWWVLLVVGVPLISRGTRILRRSRHG